VAKCSVCGAEAVAYVPYARRYLCAKHFSEFIESKVERAVERFKMVKRGDRILAALSGGKDSSTMVYILSKLSEKMGFELTALHIDLGIPSYSEHARRAAEEVAKYAGVELVVFDMRKVLGVGVPELAKRIGRPYCSVCGTVKRYIINAAAVELGANAVALGHNADDMAVYALKAFADQDLRTLAKMGPKTEGVEGGVARIRPLYTVYEKEAFIYAYVNGIPFLREECPLAPRRHMLLSLKEFVNKLEDESPSFKLGLLSKLSKNLEFYRKAVEEEKTQTCRLCGLMSSGDVCSFCKITSKALGEAMGPAVRSHFRTLNQGEVQQPSAT